MRLPVFLLLLCPLPAFAAKPVVEETVDQVWIVDVRVVYDGDLENATPSRELVFVRDGQIIDTRPHYDDMMFSVRDGRFFLSWGNYSCDRLIWFGSLHLAEDVRESRPWWAMKPVRKGLKEPEHE